jgi:hypothetical protein
MVVNLQFYPYIIPHFGEFATDEDWQTFRGEGCIFQCFAQHLCISREYLTTCGIQYLHKAVRSVRVFASVCGLFSAAVGCIIAVYHPKGEFMEQKFIAAWAANREKAARLGVRMRPVAPEEAMKNAHRCLSGNRISDGFSILADKGHLELSLEALVVDKRFTGLFTDEEANNALMRLLDAGYRF